MCTRMKNDDELLDEITAYLRNEPVPEMPNVLARTARTPVARPRRWVGTAVAAGIVAASLDGFLIWRNFVETDQPKVPGVVAAPPSKPSAPTIVVLPIDLTKPLTQLDGRLDEIDQEIAVLRRQAALLDVRRKADELLVQQ